MRVENFQINTYFCSNIYEKYTESVSLFSNCERRKFIRRENRQTTSHAVPCGYQRGLLLILSSRFPTTYNSKISLLHHAFFLLVNHCQIADGKNLERRHLTLIIHNKNPAIYLIKTYCWIILN